MKNKFLKILSLILSFGVTISNFSNAFAGGSFSKPKMSDNVKRADEIINGVPGRPGFMNMPVYAEDGGLAYFWAWNHVVCREDFEAFVAKYRNKANNTTSASSLADSQRNENWATMSSYGNGYTLEWFEESRETDPSKYLLRIDEANHLIYTVRKSGDLYLFTFYTASANTYEPYPKLVISCFAISSEMGNIKKLLLPIDRQLLG